MRNLDRTEGACAPAGAVQPLTRRDLNGAPGFYGWENADIPAARPIYPGISTPVSLYYALRRVWCAETCAPRMRGDWSPENPTLGQCSVTAFLAQDVFGGRVFGIPLKDGGFHCYNVVEGRAFDLTSEQFGSEKLAYEGNPEQYREVHFAKEEKRLRYELLRKRLMEAQKACCPVYLDIDVICEEALQVSGADMDAVMIPFSGTADSAFFSGRIIGPGVDTQQIRKDGTLRLSARYMLEGTDRDGRACRIFVENQGSWSDGFVPRIITDSESLAFLETAPLCAVIDGTEKGVRVRVFPREWPGTL